MSYEKDKLDSYVSSASLSTLLGTYVTSNSLSAALASLDLSPYMTSNSISAAVATNALTVRGAASVSATLSAAAVTVSGYPVGGALLGYQAVSNVTSVGFSGSWSDYPLMELRVMYMVSGTNAASIALYTDGGTTPFLATNTLTNAPFGPVVECIGRIMGNNTAQKYVFGSWYRSFDNAQLTNNTATANSGFINCIRMGQSKTMSSGFAMLIGYRSS